MDHARCPSCGIPTVPDHEDLYYEDMLCDWCYARYMRQLEQRDEDRAVEDGTFDN